jgi:hypothetical protein
MHRQVGLVDIHHPAAGVGAEQAQRRRVPPRARCCMLRPARAGPVCATSGRASAHRVPALHR